MKHLLSIDDLDRSEIEGLLALTDHFVEVNRRPIPKVPALRGKTVVSLFFEDSTRTRLSFETAARRLSADTMTFTASTSSVKKGESLRDTVETISAFGIDALVVRHRSSGAPLQVTQWTSATVINGGDGWHQHPTQGLLDAYTIRERLGSLDGVRIAIVGDIKHSRVLVGPPTLLPPSLVGWPVTVSHRLDQVLEAVDVIYLLRMQHERMNEALVPSLREYTELYGLTAQRTERVRDDVVIMHPGPMNRGVEISQEATAHPGAVITDQVANGVAVRMAVLFRLLGSESQLDVLRVAD